MKFTVGKPGSTNKASHGVQFDDTIHVRTSTNTEPHNQHCNCNLSRGGKLINVSLDANKQRCVSLTLGAVLRRARELWLH